MLSGNGRHRRPRQAPALVVAAGVTGSAIAIPLLGATGAHAADGAAWDRVAECETGGAWSQNSGNGYYGGLQLSQSDWEAYGGLTYAATADQASRAQQIRVAEKVLAAKGTSTWPTCGLLAGLDGDTSGSTASDTKSDDSSGSSSDESSGADDSTGDTDGADDTDDAGGTGSSASPSDKPSDKTTDDSPSDESDESPKPDTSADSDSATGSGIGSGTGSGSGSASGSATDDPTDAATTEPDDAGNLEPNPATSHLTETVGSGEAGAGADSGTGRHRGGTAGDEAVEGRSETSSGRHASRGESGSRDARDGTYTVRTGDSLWAIADSLDLAGGWDSLYTENKDTVGTDPDHILPGQKLAVAVEPGEK